MNVDFLFSPDPSQIGALVLDVLVSEKVSLKAEVTEFPIEGESDGADHVIRKPVRLSISGYIAATDAMTFFGGGGFKHKDALDTIQYIMEQRLPMTVITGMTRYHDMVVESFDASRSNGDKGGNWLQIDADLVQITKVTLRTAEIKADPARASSATGRAGSTSQAAGRAAPAGGTALGPPTPPTSTLYRATQGGTSIQGPLDAVRDTIGRGLTP